MNAWFLISVLGMAELWAAICGAMVVSYLVLRKTRWMEDKRKRKAFKSVTILFVLSFTITFLLVYSLKVGFGIPRNCILCPEAGCNPYCLPDSAFPSGHAATIFTFFASFTVIARSKWSIGVLGLAVLVSVSRLVLGVHSLTDIAAGAAVGVAVALAVWALERRSRWGQITPRNG